jgi:hypothetical protein
MSKYFDLFPKVYYSLEDGSKNPVAVTDITFAIRILEKYATDARYYYTQVIKDGLRPEDVAYLVYGDAELHWVVLHFNKIVNPLFDWPLSSLNFDRVMADRYGSLANAQSSIHTYYKVVTRLSSESEEPDTFKIEVGAAEYANLTLDLAGTDYALGNSETVRVYTNRESISVYDWELQENDTKREIKLIQKSFIPQIRAELKTLTSTASKR